MSTRTIPGRGLRVAELANEAGVSPATIRYYERVGLLPAPARTRTGDRVYTPEVADRLRFIQGCQRLGLRLADECPWFDDGEARFVDALSSAIAEGFRRAVIVSHVNTATAMTPRQVSSCLTAAVSSWPARCACCAGRAPTEAAGRYRC